MSKKVLVVDDSASVRQQVNAALQAAGFFVLEAVDGVDGIECIASTPDLALVICDVNMPRLNGLELLERIKGGGEYDELPIVMLTTEGQPQLIQQAKIAGAKGWIVKPFKPDLLVSAVQKLTATDAKAA
ncbi:MAG: two-component system chemotaxis response regulator CheY [Bradymonadia bacterium]|jgi:two-component system chemotaxis response regulator CheY